MRPGVGTRFLRWAGILSGLALVVIGFDLPGPGVLGLLLALLGVVLILLVALSGRVRPTEDDPGSPPRTAGERPGSPNVAPRDAGRRM